MDFVSGEKLGISGERDASLELACLGVAPAATFLSMLSVEPLEQVRFCRPLSTCLQFADKLLGCCLFERWLSHRSFKVPNVILPNRSQAYLVLFLMSDARIEGSAGVSSESGGPSRPLHELVNDSRIAEQQPQAP